MMIRLESYGQVWLGLAGLLYSCQHTPHFPLTYLFCLPFSDRPGGHEEVLRRLLQHPSAASLLSAKDARGRTPRTLAKVCVPRQTHCHASILSAAPIVFGPSSIFLSQHLTSHSLFRVFVCVCRGLGTRVQSRSWRRHRPGQHAGGEQAPIEQPIWRANIYVNQAAMRKEVYRGKEG